ncbi:PPE family protein [Mycolicibacter sp. MYC123]|uniref:PPE family protein n=1 Tax=[Mycobacterium] zoologicum TaxID=2872311 RepID=A0ABU5YGC8_9MYCO|nr:MULTISPECIES: PPE family protein [unclassified Mycolicibacter]MEB3048850.1 PPE family protein [Mycolicibacter sp. MYC123]MEB3062062.1 PPE family protein [Mycolicibacter sp. MYC101]
MDYLSSPPEVTSTKIYSGPGSEPMTVASSAWSALAAELKSVAASYRAVISQLTTEEWLGSASATMATAAAPYVAWMELTAAQAEQAAGQGRAAAGAYETARATIVPPTAVTANRQLLQQLVSTNILGQNTPSIAATEAEHGEMWAQDTLAMYGYHAQSAAASKLSDFTTPPNPTNPGDSTGAAVAQATSGASATKASSTLQNLFSSLTANSAESTGNPAQDILNDPNYNLSNQLMTQLVTGSNLQSNNICAVWRGVSGVLGLQKLGADAMKGASSAASGAASGAASAASGAAGAAANLGGAGAIGGLSVPTSWVPPMPAASTLGPVSGGSWVPVGPAATVPSAAGILGTTPMAPPAGMPGMAGMPGVPAAGAAGAGFRGFGGPRYGTALTVMPRRPFGG